MKQEAQFLIDRLDEYDPEDDDHVRDFNGHVAPAIARLRGALSGDVASVPVEDIQEAIDLLGGFMGSVSGYRRAEELRDRLRSYQQNPRK